MNRPIIMARAAVAVLISVVAATPHLAAFAQYGGDVPGTVSPEQLRECEQLQIDRALCNDVNILAKKRLIAAQENPATGSGTPMLSTEAGQMAIFIGVLGAIFGGVAAAFFFAGRRGKTVTT